MISIICKCGYEVDVDDVEPTVGRFVDGGFVEPLRACPRCKRIGLWTLATDADDD